VSSSRKSQMKTRLCSGSHRSLMKAYRVSGTDYLSPGAFKVLVVEDYPDPWGMLVDSFRKVAGSFSLMTREESACFAGISLQELDPVRVIEDGPARTVVEALFKYSSSSLCVRYKIPKQDHAFEIEIRVYWNEKDRMIKLSIPTAFLDGGCSGQVAYGVEDFKERAVELVAQKWIGVHSANNQHTLTVINDGTHGFDFLERKISIFPTLNDFYEKNPPVDLVIIASPVHHHVTQSCQALQRGSFVLCEKPLSATVQDARRLISETFTTNRWVKIGYQWSFSEAIQTLKKDIIQGRFGSPLRLKTLCFWPRDLFYFQRNDWAGKKLSEEGRWIFDSPANNAMAHFLHNIFYVLGDRPDLSAMPKEVMAELYRAYPIKNYDTIACRAWTIGGAEILFFASHSTFEELGPMFSFEFEKGIVSFGENSNTVMAITNDGEEINFGSLDKDPFHL